MIEFDLRALLAALSEHDVHFVIIGGVTRVIPLTGITLPFVSYGGSSVISNFLVVAGLMLVSHKANS